MNDGELRKLATEGGSLSEAARESLRAEIARRGLDVAVFDAPIGRSVAPLPIILRRFLFLSDALLAKTILDSAEIECFVADEHTIRMDWLRSLALGQVKLWVRAEDADAAGTPGRRAARVIRRGRSRRIQAAAVPEVWFVRRLLPRIDKTCRLRKHRRFLVGTDRAADSTSPPRLEVPFVRTFVGRIERAARTSSIGAHRSVPGPAQTGVSVPQCHAGGMWKTRSALPWVIFSMSTSGSGALLMKFTAPSVS